MEIDNDRSKISLLQFVNTLEFGGATDYALTLCENLDKSVYDVRLATGPGSGWEDRAAECTADVLVLDKMKPTHTRESENTVLGDVVSLFKLYRYLKENNVQVIHSHGSKSRLYGGLVSLIARTPVRIQSAHGFAFNSEMSKWKFLIFVQLERLMGLLYHQLVLESEYDLSVARQYSLSKNTCCIYTGIKEPVNAKVADAKELRASIGIPEDAVMVLMVGRLSEQKDPHTYVKTALTVNEQCQSTYFVVVGDGDLYTSTEKIASGSGRIKLLGRRTDVADLIDACDIYLLTSRWEGIPITILMAMALGKPVVVTDKLGLPEVVVDGVTGFVAQEGDAASYASKVLDLAQTESLRDEMGSKGRELIDSRYNINLMIEEFDNLYKGKS